jgi:outer membrane receptor protein involved in Fe transport
MGGAALVLGVLPLTTPCAQTTPVPTQLPSFTIIGTTPLVGTGIDRDKLPGQVSVLNSTDLSRDGTPDLTRALNERVGGVTLNNAAGNPYQPDVYYRGFRASPFQGTEEGLAVYANGVRFNQPFGDTVNWDLIPSEAIDQVNLAGSNPAFGLNALGGSLNLQLKNGFAWHGLDASVSGGSFGRVAGDLQYGKQSGNVAGYIALSGTHEDGWRDLQSSDIANLYADLGWRNDRSELHISVTAANSRLNGPGTAPVQLLAVDPRAQFTAPNRIDNQYLQGVASVSTDLSSTLSIQANAYVGYFRQFVLNGNAPGFGGCDDGAGLLCDMSGSLLTTRGGTPIPDYLNGGPYGQLDQQTTVTNSYGAAAQTIYTGALGGFANRLVGGISFDGAASTFGARSSVGGLSALTRAFIGPGITIDQADGSITPVRVDINNANYGLFATDTLDLTDRLAATVSGRLNATQTDLLDRSGTALNGNHSYERFNPAFGLTYRAAPWLTVYAGYAEANRAPTPAELSCASAAAPCSLANFFVGDPDLKQVVAHTVETGVRGRFEPFEGGTLHYDLGFFHSSLSDDIQFVNSPILGRAYFENVGQTRRQGVDANVQLTTARWLGWIGYAYTDARFAHGFIESRGNNPAADANGNITVRPGNRLPGIPAQQVKLGVRFQATEAWTIGATAVGTTGTYLFGDEANLTPRLPGYFVVNLSTSYQVTDHVQIFGLVENLTDRRYYAYGTFSPTASVALAQAPGSTNPRSYNLAAPIGGYGGLRVMF